MTFKGQINVNDSSGLYFLYHEYALTWVYLKQTLAAIWPLSLPHDPDLISLLVNL